MGLKFGGGCEKIRNVCELILSRFHPFLFRNLLSWFENSRKTFPKRWPKCLLSLFLKSFFSLVDFSVCGLFITTCKRFLTLLNRFGYPWRYWVLQRQASWMYFLPAVITRYQEVNRGFFLAYLAFSKFHSIFLRNTNESLGVPTAGHQAAFEGCL